jgi:hypothetical protein
MEDSNNKKDTHLCGEQHNRNEDKIYHFNVVYVCAGQFWEECTIRVTCIMF